MERETKIYKTKERKINIKKEKEKECRRHTDTKRKTDKQTATARGSEIRRRIAGRSRKMAGTRASSLHTRPSVGTFPQQDEYVAPPLECQPEGVRTHCIYFALYGSSGFAVPLMPFGHWNTRGASSCLHFGSSHSPVL